MQITRSTSLAGREDPSFIDAFPRRDRRELDSPTEVVLGQSPRRHRRSFSLEKDEEERSKTHRRHRPSRDVQQ